MGVVVRLPVPYVEIRILFSNRCGYLFPTNRIETRAYDLS